MCEGTLCVCTCIYEIMYVDINECVEINIMHNCSQECINDIGSYHCQCFEGYELSGNYECIGNN